MLPGFRQVFSLPYQSAGESPSESPTGANEIFAAPDITFDALKHLQDESGAFITTNCGYPMEVA